MWIINLFNINHKVLSLNVVLAIFFASFSLSGYAQNADATAALEEEEIKVLFDSVMASDKYIEKLDSGSFYNLPLGIMGGDNNDPNYAILIDEVVLYPDKATFSASMVLTNPMDNSKMVFAAREVPFTFSGGIQGVFRLELISEKPISLCEDMGLQILKGSYVEADCKGFKSLHVKGRFELNENKYTPADNKGKPLAGKVSSFFEVTLQNWNDLTFSISLEPFQLKKYPDFTFQCQNLSVDFSDLKNPTSLKFPQGYESPYPPELIQLWRGVYIESASLILNGDKFQRKNNPEPLAFGVENLIIDELGFTGKVLAENLISLEQGSLAGWKFSIDKIYLEFLTSSLTGGGLEGLIHIPVFDDGTNFEYSAFVDVEGNYGFTVSPDDTMSFTMFGNSKLDLYETSFININSDSTGFVPTACLNGKMTISGKVKTSDSESTSSSGGESSLNLADLEFQEFRISTREPLIDIKYMAYHGSGQGKLSKFPITISDIVFSSTPANAKLSITAVVNLKKDSGEGFGGRGTISLLADRNEYKYTFKGVQVDELSIDVVKPGAFELHGRIAFARGDSIYGNGFNGSLDVTFGGNIEIEAQAMFGNVDGYRYFYVDGMFAMKPGIQAGPITIFGFGGGLYHHMRQVRDAAGAQYDFGRTQSGIVYRPDDHIALGIKAGIKLGIGGEQIINAEAKFEIAFTTSAGISYISFEGLAQCITPPIPIDVEKIKNLAGNVVSQEEGSTVPTPGEGAGASAIAASLKMFKDFENDEFHAEMEIYLNIAGVITGVGANNRAGWAVVHSSKKEWYIHIGTPTDPIGISVLGLVSFKSYFMAGHRLPATMPIHPKVAEILNISPEEISGKRDEYSVEAGRGIAFGASFEISTGDRSFLIFYGSFDLGIGFDIMLADYGSGAYCLGSSPPLGINGWYAKGQSYAYFAGKIGLQAKIFGKTKKFEILSIATAAYLRAEAPNPVWMIGYVGGSYRILGGMIKGDCKFGVEVGERCDIQGGRSKLLDLQLISEINPGDNSEDVDVFTTPQIIFNVPVEKQQKISEDDGTLVYFRIKIVEMKMNEEDVPVPFTSKWNSNKDVVQIIPDYVLYPKKDYTMEVKIAFEEKVDGVWREFEHEGEQLTETRTVKFETGELPDRIPDDEITYSYPVDRQFNFMPGEYNKGYLIFRRDLQAFFAPSEIYDRKVRWKPAGGAVVNSNIDYRSDEKTLYFDLPGNMQLNKIYSMELAAIPIVSSNEADRNVTTTYEEEEFEGDTSNTTVEQVSKTADGTITTPEEKIMFDLDLKTSQYNDFNTRFNEDQLTVRAFIDAGYMEFLMFVNTPGGEALDKYEKPNPNGWSFFKMEADLSETEWFKDDVFPKTYERYPWYNFHAIRWRDTTRCGLKAQRAISMGQPVGFSSLTDADISAGTPVYYASYSDIVYMQPYFWDEDYMTIRDALAFYTRDQEITDPMINTILTNIKLRPVKPGDYPIKVSYVLPGKNIITSSKTINITSTIKTHEEDY